MDYENSIEVKTTGADGLQVIHMDYQDELGRPYVMQLCLVQTLEEDANPEEVITPDTMIGTSFAFEITMAQEQSRCFNGIVTHFQLDSYDRKFAYYRARVEPKFALMRQTSDCRVFQEQTVDKIIETVLQEAGVTADLSGVKGSFVAAEVTLQYNESYFDFVSRLMQEYGIFYYWQHTDSDHTMMLCDDPTAFAASELYASEIPFLQKNFPDTPPVTPEALPPFKWPDRRSKSFQEGSKALFAGVAEEEDEGFGDDDELQDDEVAVEAESRLDQESDASVEMVYTLRVQGHHVPSAVQVATKDATDIATPIEAAEQPVVEYSTEITDNGLFEAHLQATDEAGATALAKTKSEAVSVAQEIYFGEGTTCSMEAGTTLSIIEHPVKSFNQEYQVLSTHIVIVSPLDQEGWNAAKVGAAAYRCRFRLQKAGAVYRTPYYTPRPKIVGPQLAKVVGPSGDEIHTDEFGRIKVEFFWDRESEGDDSAFCFIPVVQNWAGNGFGSQFIPRIGSTVVVNFMDGNPDRPICTGGIFTDVEKPPFALPDEMNKSGIRTKSTTGGGAEDYNEIVFDDTAGEEKLSITAQLDLDTMVKNNLTLEVQKESLITLVDKVTGECQADVEVTYSATVTYTYEGEVTITFGAAVSYEYKDTHNVVHSGAVTYEYKDAFDAKHSGAVSVKCDDAYSLEAKEISGKGQSAIAFEVGSSTLEISSSGIKMAVGNSEIELSASAIKIVCGGNEIAVGAASMKINATMLKVKGLQVDIKADTMLKVGGSIVQFESAGPAMVKGTPLMLN